MTDPGLIHGRRVLIVIPAWNEEESVGAVVGEVRGALPDAHVLVVNDQSTDQTESAARAAGAEVLRLPINLGVGGAMRAGFRWAQAQGYDAVVQVDADGQHPADRIADLVRALEGWSVVIGSRFADGSSYTVRGPRRWAMRFLSWSLSALARTRLTDVTSGFRAADRRAIDLFARDYPAEYLGDTVESLVLATRAGLGIGEIAVTMRPRMAGTPSQPVWRAGLYLGRAVLAFALALLRKPPRTAPPPAAAPPAASEGRGAA